MKTKTLTNVPGYEDQEVVIKRFDYGEKLDIQEDSISVSLKDGKEVADVSIAKLKLNTIINGILSAPFFTMADKKQRLKEVRGLDQEVGDFLYLEIQGFNGKKLNEEVKKKLEPSLEETSSAGEDTEMKQEESLPKP